MLVDYYKTPHVGGHENDRYIEYELSQILALSQLGQAKMTAQALATEKASEIQYGPITVEDTDAVIEMLKASFFKDEPLNTYLDLGVCEELENYASKSIKDNCSFKAMSSTGKIIGVFLNGEMKRPAPEEDREPAAPSCAHPKFKKVLGLMDMIDTRFNLFEMFPEIDTAIDGKILSVDPTYRGKGIANELTRLTIDHMRVRGIPLMHVLCTSHYSAQLMKKLSFESVFVFPLADYMDADGVQVLKPDLPHVQAEVMIKRVL